jgi:hypothetical protein
MTANEQTQETTEQETAPEAPTYEFNYTSGVNQNGKSYKRYELARMFSSMIGQSHDISGFWNGPGSNPRTAIFNAMQGMVRGGRNRQFFEAFIASNSQPVRVRDQMTNQSVAARRVRIAGYIAPEPRAGRTVINPTSGKKWDFIIEKTSMGDVADLADLVLVELRQVLFAAVPRNDAGSPADAPAQAKREDLIGLIPGAPDTQAPF